MGLHDRERDWASRANDGEECYDGTLEGAGAGHAPVTFRTSFKTAIVNRKSAMLLLSQVSGRFRMAL